MCDIFYANSDVLSFKEVEQRAAKKGVPSMQVKDILQDLIDDGIVNCERMGASLYYWSFRSMAAIKRKNAIEDLSTKISQITSQIRDNEAKIIELQPGREDTDERLTILEEYDELQRQNTLITKELAQYKELDPDIFEEKTRQVKEADAAIERWTDNIYTLQSLCTKRFMCTRNQFCEWFNIPEDI